MPKPPKPLNAPDQRKAGLQDDHDPRDIGQKQNDLPGASGRAARRTKPAQRRTERWAEEAAGAALVAFLANSRQHNTSICQTSRVTPKAGCQSLQFAPASQR